MWVCWQFAVHSRWLAGAPAFHPSQTRALHATALRRNLLCFLNLFHNAFKPALMLQDVKPELVKRLLQVGAPCL